MKNTITELSFKIDKILEQQELILNILESKGIIVNDKVNYTNNSITTKKAKNIPHDYYRNFVKENFELKPYKAKLQKQFNLATKPHSNRVKEYLKTQKISVFDGLLRNN